jgi:hypothetical protein
LSAHERLNATDFGIWILDFGIWILGFGFWVLGFGIWNLEFGIWNLEFGIWNLEFSKFKVLVLHKSKFMGIFSKIKSSFGSQNETDSNINPSYIEDIINEIENEPFAVSELNVMYAGLGEIAGYHLLQTVIVGTFRIKTFKGAKLKIKGTDFELNLNSDMIELESDFSNVSNRSITKIDFEIDEQDLLKIVKSKIESLELSAKKERVQFSIVHIVKDKVEEEEEEE